MVAHADNGENDFLEALLTIPAIYNYKISKDSRYVAYTWKNVHPNLDVFLVPTSGTKRPIALTKTSEATFIVDFAPDSLSVIVGEDKNRNERVRLFEVKIDKPRQMTPLTEEDPPFFLRGGALHPTENGSYMAPTMTQKAKRKSNQHGCTDTTSVPGRK